VPRCDLASCCVSRNPAAAATNVTHPVTGNYCFYNLGFTPKNVVVTAEFYTGIRINTVSSWEGAVNFNCSGSPLFSIQTQNSSGTATNTSLYVLID